MRHLIKVRIEMISMGEAHKSERGMAKCEGLDQQQAKS